MTFGPGSVLYESYGDRLGYLCAGTTGLLQLMLPALGRGVEHSDMPLVRSIARKAAAQDYRFSAVVLGIVESPPFMVKKGVAEAPAATAQASH